MARAGNARGTGSRTPDAPRRLSLSEILELMLTRPASEHSSVSLTRNAKGETQIEVTVRTGDAGGTETAAEAAAEAQSIYDRLRATYPLANGSTSGGAA